MTIDGEKQQVTKVTKVTKVTGEKLAVGEDAVARTVGTKTDDEPVETKAVVFRRGTTLAGSRLQHRGDPAGARRSSSRPPWSTQAAKLG